MLVKQIDKFLMILFRRIERKIENEKLKTIKKELNYQNESISLGKNYKILNPKYITIGANFSSGVFLRLEAIDNYSNNNFTPCIKIGNNVSFEDFCHVGAIKSIIIEDNVMIASKVIITDHFHGETNLTSIKIAPKLRTLYCKGPILIKQNVWIGDNVSIFSNVTIGENSIIGANSVVTKNIPPNSIAIGSPARIIKQY